MKTDRKFALSFLQDRRLSSIADAFLRAGYHFGIAGCTFPKGMPHGCTLVPQIREGLSEADLVILPLPSIKDGGEIAFSEERILFSDLLSCLPSNAVVLGGMFPPSALSLAAERGFRVIDYYDSEEVRQKNAVLTAEAAMYLMMQDLSVSLPESRIAVVGCGRIGAALCELLRKNGASVCALARRWESLYLAVACGCEPALLSAESLSLLGGEYDIVCNTVPERIFGREVLLNASARDPARRTLYLDLSSAPGGFDPIAARETGIRLLWALSLPGKYAPYSAGRVLGEEMLKRLSKLEKEGGV